MRSRGARIEWCLRASVLVSICLIIYVGPASTVGIDELFDDEIFGGTSGFEMVMWMVIVWLFSIPLIVAHITWDTNPAKSTVGLGIFLATTLLIWMLLPGFGIWLLATAIAAPFDIGSANGLSVDIFYSTANVLAFVVCVVIPTTAIAFQVSRRKDWGRMLY